MAVLSTTSRPQGLEIAIIGMSGRFPGAPDIETFWKNVVGGTESVRFFTDAELRGTGVSENDLRSPHYVKARAVMDCVDCFDADFFGISMGDANIMDPQ